MDSLNWRLPLVRCDINNGENALYGNDNASIIPHANT